MSPISEAICWRTLSLHLQLLRVLQHHGDARRVPRRTAKGLRREWVKRRRREVKKRMGQEETERG